MHRIYACASFTIIAADGADANYGLRGFRNLTAPRELLQEPVQLAASERIINHFASWKHGNMESSRPTQIYYNRAWTFQEMLFSKRRLTFENGSIKWQCQCSYWLEHLLPYVGLDERSINYDGSERWFHRLVPTLSSISNIIRRYKIRILTFSKDAFSAFAGIQTMLHRTYPFGLIYGHPELFFDISLTWCPVGHVKRRKAYAKSQLSVVSHQLPSWSWVGWAGELTFP